MQKRIFSIMLHTRSISVSIIGLIQAPATPPQRLRIGWLIASKNASGPDLLVFGLPEIMPVMGHSGARVDCGSPFDNLLFPDEVPAYFVTSRNVLEQTGTGATPSSPYPHAFGVSDLHPE